MQIFQPDNATLTPEHRRVYAAYEVCYTAVDFAAAFLFVAGSVLFFWQSTTFTATWMFLVGSICFALKPTLRLAREMHYLRLGDYSDLADRDRARSS